MAAAPPAERFRLFGPVFARELVRLSRGGRNTVLRVGYALALLAALAVAYHSTFGLGDWFANAPSVSTNERARLAESFSIAILVVQNLAVLALAPIYLADCVIAERQAKTLDLLVMTHLGLDEILLDKFLARVVHLGGILLTGLPVLMLVQLWGSFSPTLLLFNFVNTLLLLLFACGACLLAAVERVSPLSALLRAYAFLGSAMALGLFWTCCCPFASPFLIYPASVPYFGGWSYLPMLVLASAELSMTACFLTGALREFRREVGRSAEAARSDNPSGPIDNSKAAYRPPLWENALFWKERTDPKPMPIREQWNLFLLVAYLQFLAGLVLGFAQNTWGDRPGDLALSLRLMLFTQLPSLGIYVLHVTLALTGCVARERQMNTLDGLLTLPVSRKEILQAKFLGNLASGWALALPFVLGWLVATAFGALGMLEALLVIVAIATHLLFFATLGLCLSGNSAIPQTAYLRVGLVALVLIVGLPVVAALTLPHGSWGRDLLVSGLSPLGCWFDCLANTWTGEERPGTAPWLSATLAGLGLYWLATLAFGALAWRGFERDPIRRSGG